MDEDENTCRRCGQNFPSSRALGGHIGHCKRRQVPLTDASANRGKRARALDVGVPEQPHLPPGPVLPAGPPPSPRPPLAPQADEYEYENNAEYEDAELEGAPHAVDAGDGVEGGGGPPPPGLPRVIGNLDLRQKSIVLPEYQTPTHGDLSLDRVAEFLDTFVGSEIGVDEFFKLQHVFPKFFIKYTSACAFKAARDSLSEQFVVSIILVMNQSTWLQWSPSFSHQHF